MALIFFFSTDTFAAGEEGLTYRLVRAVLVRVSPVVSPMTIEAVRTLIRKLAHILESHPKHCA